ncbi:MAG: FAD-dependent oxidoreductase [Rhodothermales bacterium]
MKVSIVGAGIHGLSTAVQARRMGMSVTLYDQGPIPNPASSSHDAHRLIRHTYGDRHGYAQLVVDAYRAWDRLWEQTGISRYVPTGTLAVGFKGSKWIHHSVKSLRRLGLTVEALPAGALRERFPWILLDHQDDALYAPGGGILLADRILEDLAILARQTGVDIQENRRIIPEHLPSDQTTLWCTGAWTHMPDVIPSRQVIGYLQERPSWAGIASHPDGAYPMILDLDERGGLYVVPGVAGTPWKIGMHTFSRSGSPDDSREVSSKELDELGHLYRSRIADPTGPGILAGRACWYAVQEDSRFQLRETPMGLHFYGGSGHSFKFGALTGEILASVLTGNTRVGDAARVLSGRG